eukprot:UN00035
MSEKKSVRFLVHRFTVPVLIGEGGKTLQNIVATTKCQVAIESVGSTVPFKLQDAIPTRVLTIYYENTKQLADALEKIIDLTDIAKRQAMDKMSKLSADNVSFQALCHKAGVHQLLDQSGALIKKTQEATKSSIKIKAVLRDSSEAPIIVSAATSADVAKAIIAILPQLLDHSSPDDADEAKRYKRYTSCLPIHDGDEKSERKITVDQEDTPYIIGKAGQRVKFITHLTGCRTKVDQTPNKDGKVTVTVTGPSRNLFYAVMLVTRSKSAAESQAAKLNGNQ